MSSRVLSLVAAMLVAVSVASQGATIPDNWDGLVRVKAKRMDAAFLAPGADFRPYAKVMIDPTEVAFRKNWQRDHNSAMSLTGRVSDADVRRILDEARQGFQAILADAYRAAGYEVVSLPGPDVMRLSTAVINLDIAAPDVMTPGRTRTFSRDAGGAELVLEARDSLSGALLGRAIDGKVADDAPFIRNSVTNRSAFERIFARWAKTSAQALSELKLLSPIDANGQLRR